MLTQIPRPAAPTLPGVARRGQPWSWFATPAQARPIRLALAEGGYLGAALLAGGLIVLLGRYGFSFAQTEMGALLIVLAVVSAGLGLVVGDGLRNLPALAAEESSPRRAMAGAFFALAAVTTAGAVGVLASRHAWFAGGMAGLLVAVAGYLVLPTAAGVLVGVVLGLIADLSIVDKTGWAEPLTVGTVLLGYGTFVAVLGVAGLIRHRELGLSLGALIAVAGAQQPLIHADATGWASGLSFAVGVACLAIYRELPVITLLPLGVAGVSMAVLGATWNHTNGPAGAFITLVATGLAVSASSAVGRRLWRNSREPRHAGRS